MIPTDAQARQLATLSTRLVNKQRAYDEAEEALKALGEEIRMLSGVAIPELMDELGVESLVLTDGTQLKVVADVHASITKEHEEDAHAWMKANGYGDLIKERKVTNVHPSTLKAWARERVEAGDSLPDLFSVFVGRKTTVK